jgi:MFS family permease
MVAFGGCVAGYTVAWQAQTLLVLAAAAVMFQFSFSAVDITYKSLVTDFYPRQMVGQLAGAINIFYATGRTLALVSVGAIVGALDDDYRISWLIAIAAGIACILVMLTISDPRNGRRTGPAA